MKRELKNFLLFNLFAVAILALSSLPTWAGRSAQNAELSFTGLYFDATDYAVHIAMMESGIQGNWLYRLRFTTEEHRPVAIKTFYIALGHISKAIHLPAETTYHLFRWIIGYSVLYVIYRLCRRLFCDRAFYWSAFFLAVLGSGLGWLQLILGWIPGEITPIDFWLIDAYVFFSISLFPHFSFQITLMVLSFLLYLEFLEAPHWKWIGCVIAAGLLLQMVNPASLLVVDFALLVCTLIYWFREKSLRRTYALALVTIALLQVPLLAYNTSILMGDPVWSQFTAQNLTLSPPPVYYLLGFGLFWPFVGISTVNAFHKRDAALLGLLAWVACAFVLAYIPLNMQRRFLLGITIPLGLLTADGLRLSFAFVERKIAFIRSHLGPLLLLFVFIVSISSVYLALGNSIWMQTHPTGSFYPAALDPALVWLRENAGQDDVVLADASTSRMVAQRAGLKVYIGHPMETLQYEAKRTSVRQAYQNGDFSAMPVDWVIYGPYETEFAPDFHAGMHLSLEYQNQNVNIYRMDK
jgi:hypothetical protein